MKHGLNFEAKADHDSRIWNSQTDKEKTLLVPPGIMFLKTEGVEIFNTSQVGCCIIDSLFFLSFALFECRSVFLWHFVSLYIGPLTTESDWTRALPEISLPNTHRVEADNLQITVAHELGVCLDTEAFYIFLFIFIFYLAK